MSANVDPGWTVTSTTGDGVPTSVSNGEREFDVVAEGAGIGDIRDDDGNSIGTVEY